MALTLAYFAAVREVMGVDGEVLAALPDGVVTIADLVGWLARRDARGAAAFANQRLIRAARDDVMASLDTAIGAAREVALFPPVTGG
jgi:molybdopterin synthase sulfur carrier subunit